MISRMVLRYFNSLVRLIMRSMATISAVTASELAPPLGGKDLNMQRIA